MFQLLDELNSGINGCSLGVLIMTDVDNLSTHDTLDNLKHDLEENIKKKHEQTTSQELKALHPMDVYISYYKKFGYTYHVLLQLNSVIHEKTIPCVSPLVEAMFMAELKNMLLTAGHDLEKIKQPITLKPSTGTETYTGMNDKQITAIPNDIMIADSQSVISSILKGPDHRTCIDTKTKKVLYTVYAPSGIEKELIIQHLNDIEFYVRTFSPNATTQLKKV
jgi:DNA/RNA-binding domain of Phe-tRNA-synthetase-like protein